MPIRLSSSFLINVNLKLYAKFLSVRYAAQTFSRCCFNLCLQSHISQKNLACNLIIANGALVSYFLGERVKKTQHCN